MKIYIRAMKENNLSIVQPLISVLIPSYNCAQYIQQAIDSILEQEYPNLEIIVVDDGSTDNTREIVEAYLSDVDYNKYHTKNIKYFNKEHSGISSSRNLCLAKASGELIAWCDADDYWLPGKLKAQMEFLSESTECQVIFTRFENFFENENLKNHPKAMLELEWETKIKNYLPSGLFKRQVFEICGNFSTDFIIAEDTEILESMKMFGVDTSHCLDKCFYMRRLHGCNITLTLEKENPNTLFAKIYLQYAKRKVKNNLLKNKIIE